MNLWKSLVEAVRRCKKIFHCRTYVIEYIVAWSALVITAIISDKAYIERIWVIAVFLTFCYIGITDRLQEREHLRQTNPTPSDKKNLVECYYKLPRFYYGKEICWAIYFVYLGAWSALVWVAIFLLYWPRRKLYRKYYPIS